MKIMLNGKECQIEEGSTAGVLLETMGYKGKTAVWINGVQLLLSDYQKHLIKEADQVKILRIIGGG